MANFIKFSNLKKPHAICHAKDIDISLGRGFLPEVDPITISDNLEFNKLVSFSTELPVMLKKKQVISRVEQEFNIDVESLIDCSNQPILLRSYAMMAAITQAYIIESGGGKDTNKAPVYIDEKLSTPLHALSSAIDRLPTQTYETYILQNYKLLDPLKEISLENISPLITYTNTSGEAWFIKVHVVAEYLGGRVLQSFNEAQSRAMQTNFDSNDLIQLLKDTTHAMDNLGSHLRTMNNGLDSKEFYSNVRSYLKSWEPGVIYKGSDIYGDSSIVWRGSSGAQSSIIPAIDRLMGLNISQLETMKDMVNYMPIEHQNFLSTLNNNQFELRDIIKKYSADIELVASYNDLVLSNAMFRKIHYEEIVEKYIIGNIVNRFIEGKAGEAGIIDKVREIEVIKDSKCSWASDNNIRSLLYNLFKLTKSYIVENADQEINPKNMMIILEAINAQVIESLDSSCNLSKVNIDVFEHDFVQKQCNLILGAVQLPLEGVDINVIELIGQSNIVLAAQTLGTGGTDFTYFLQKNIIQVVEASIDANQDLSLAGCVEEVGCL